MSAKRVAIDLDLLESALTDHGGTEWFLDTKTGEVIMGDELPDDDWDEDEEPDEEPEEPSDGDTDADEAEDEDDFDRYIRINPLPSYMEYQDMEDFADDVSDERLRSLLVVALDGKGAFRRFKNVLLDFPNERERWFKFRDERMHKRVLEWLEENELEVEDK